MSSNDQPTGLRDRTVAIIGGSSGMGFAAARHAVRAGANVIIAARTPERLERAARELEGQSGRPVIWRSLAIENRDEVRSWLEANAPIDHLLLPGSTVEPVSFDALTESRAQAAFASKFWGPLWTVYDARPFLTRGSSVVLFSGVAAQRPVRGYLIGAAINGALEAACRSLALELAPLGVRVNVVAPGFIMTPLFRTLHTPEDVEQRLEEARRRLPLGRPGTPDEAALAITYLMENGFVTGQVLTVDGGLVVME